MRDPGVKDPKDSSWGKIYIETAGNFIGYVGSQPDKIVSDRAAQITPVAFVERWSGGGRNGPFDRSYWWFEDRGWPLRREFPRTSGWTLQRAQDQRENHY